MKRFIFFMVVITMSATPFLTAQGHEAHHGHKTISAGKHAPIGVMGDHMHKTGEWMLAYRYMHMDMNGNRDGTSDINAATIATTVPNRFAAVAGQPPTLRVVPTEMTMDMHMVGGMYAPADWLTVMAMGRYLEKDMTSITFAGAAGTGVLGENSMESNGWGDARISSLIRLYENNIHHLHLNAGLSLPTGAIDKSASMLMPNGMRMERRMSYGMQLGTGTYDLLPGLTYTGHKERWGWGAQYSAEIRLEDENDEGYAWGDRHSVTSWGSYDWMPWFSTSARLTATASGKIDGIDPQIMGPTQGADPDNYGGKTVDIGLGANFIIPRGPLTGHRLAIESGAPFYSNLNGPQLKRNWTVTIGWQYAF